ncbi:hypothetical protein ES702_02456 [subsurface metagenome]
MIPFSVHGSPYQYKKVEAGKSAVVYKYDLPSVYVGFMYDLALSWYPKTYLGWEIDNHMVEHIEREIGEFKRPKLFDPPYFFEKQIKFTAYNNSKSAQTFRILCDGILIRKIT